MHLFQKFLKKLKLPKAFSNRKNENRFEITTGGAFQNAHHFTISEANMYDISQATDPGREVLSLLTAKGMTAAMLDSAERSGAPKCSEDTRQRVRSRIATWGRNGDESRSILWLSGPAGVGKSAIAQTIAEEFKDAELLGAAFFFSRPNGRRNPDVVIPTIAYQLATRLPGYLGVIAHKLAKDPAILDKNWATQFHALIIDPFRLLATGHPKTVEPALLIVLDGLDECDNYEAQQEFVKLISSHARTVNRSPVRWLICSRPEPQLTTAFSNADCQVTCIKERLEVDDAEAVRDAKLLFQEGFAKIRHKFRDQVSNDWPSSNQLCEIEKAASGHLGYVSFVLRYIGDEYYGNPVEGLNMCLRCSTKSGTIAAGEVHPLHALDLLYAQILSDIPPQILPNTLQILGLYLLYGDAQDDRGETPLCTMVHANFLGLDQASFYQALRHLHSVICIPSASQAHAESIRVHHASFSDFLRDPARSHEYTLDDGAVHRNVAVNGLRWMSMSHATPGMVPDFTWLPAHVTRTDALLSLFKFSTCSTWTACTQVPDGFLEDLLEVLKDFDFHLPYNTWNTPGEDFVHFIGWLVSPPIRRHSFVNVSLDEVPGSIGLQVRRTDFSLVADFCGQAQKGRLSIIHLLVGIRNPTPFQLHHPIVISRFI